MTRINVVPPQELSNLHLLAEYREITRIPNNIRKSLSRKGKSFDMSEIPPEYVLGTGHVKFFYDKGLFLSSRYEKILEEMISRGFNPKFRDSSIFFVDERFYKDYTPTEKAIELNRQRIKERS